MDFLSSTSIDYFIDKTSKVANAISKFTFFKNLNCS
jgi:hypothetical protein